MPLVAHFEKIKDYKNLCYLESKDKKGKSVYELNPITFYLRSTCLSVGIWELTEKNCKEFYYRCIFQDTLRGSKPFYNKANTDDTYSITLEQVKQHIGLRVDRYRYWLNEMTRSQFLSKEYKLFKEQLNRE